MTRAPAAAVADIHLPPQVTQPLSSVLPWQLMGSTGGRYIAGPQPAGFALAGDPYNSSNVSGPYDGYNPLADRIVGYPTVGAGWMMPHGLNGAYR